MNDYRVRIDSFLFCDVCLEEIINQLAHGTIIKIDICLNSHKGYNINRYYCLTFIWWYTNKYDKYKLSNNDRRSFLKSYSHFRK